jgi:hypothetical protein
MNGINKAFFFVIDKIIELQAFFVKEAWNVGKVALLISVCSAAVNYGLTGTGLKENIIKIGKAVVFFAIVMGAYPRIVSWITIYTFDLARGSTYSSMSAYLNNTSAAVIIKSNDRKAAEGRATYGNVITTSRDKYFGPLIVNRSFTSPSGKLFNYSSVAPVAVLQAMLLVAGECMRPADEVGFFDVGEKISKLLIGLICAIGVILCGSFALLEYLMAFMEFIFVSSVGILFFPLSLWDGSKFVAEKFISALLGFFIKMLFCTICVFLTIYGFLSLAMQFTDSPFEGLIDQVLMIIFSCLLFFYISKSAPAMAQSLMTGSPSLNAAGAIGTAVMAGGALAGAAGVGTRAALGGVSAVAQGAGAAKGAADSEKQSGNNLFRQITSGAAAFGMSMAGSGVNYTRAVGSDLTRSLLTR